MAKQFDQVDFPLPKGWRREEVVRRKGLSAGTSYVQYITPEGKTIRSKPELWKTLGKEIHIGCLDFRSGKIDYTEAHARIAHDYDKLPVPLTKRIIQGPVTLIRNHPDSETKRDLVHGSNQTPPHQLLWQRSLKYLYADDISHELRKAVRTHKNFGSTREEPSNTMPVKETSDSHLSRE